ncbi:MAG: oligosaccharide flippase family protein, partial [Myxococcales bacterium]
MMSSPDLLVVTEPAEPVAGGGHSYGQILKSSVLIGGSSAINVGLGIVRSKAMALLLGPAGFGLMGLYLSIANLAQSIAGMGINGSGVRQIAAAVGSGDNGRIARTATVLRRTSVALGVLGAALLVGLSVPISRLTFGNGERALPVALLSLAVLFRIISDGQGALVQGLRRISDMARIAVYGGVLATGATIALVYVFREQGVVPSLIATAVASLIFTWWFSRDRARAPPMDAAEVRGEARALLELGFAFMASGMLSMGAAYAIRIFIVRQLGLTAAGLYQSAWTIAGLYVGFILRAMG